MISGRNISAVRFTSDGRRILASITSRKLTVLDLERGEPIHFYDNCCFGTRERLPLATDPLCPHLAVCSCANGKGLTLFDLRMPLPFDFVFELHDNVIRDIIFLNQSWPFVSPHQCGLATVSDDGTCKITTLDGRVLHCFDIGHGTNTIACSPGQFTMDSNGGFPSVMMLAGDQLSEYTPHSHSDHAPTNKFTMEPPSLQMPTPPHSTFSRQSYPSSSLYASLQNMTNHIHLNLNLNLHPFQPRGFHANLSAQPTLTATPSLSSFESHRPRYALASNPPPISCDNCVAKTILLDENINKIKYTSNGGMLYAACDNYSVKKIRRYPNEHRIVSNVITHKSDIYDLDISPYDEFLVTASRDKTVGVLYLGPPNHGWTSYCQLT
jgi:WD40 repeat protein